ncbi:TnpA family transposase [Paraburkholderia sp. GAS334]
MASAVRLAGTGLNAITVLVPATLRDSLVLLAVVLEQQTELQPAHIMTDTDAYSDVVFGLFRLLGYRFCPRLAEIGDTPFDQRERSMKYPGRARQAQLTSLFHCSPDPNNQQDGMNFLRDFFLRCTSLDSYTACNLMSAR